MFELGWTKQAYIEENITKVTQLTNTKTIGREIITGTGVNGARYSPLSTSGDKKKTRGKDKNTVVM